MLGAASKGVELTLHDGLPGHIRGDGGRLAQMMDNLIANAIKYSDSAKDKRWVAVSARATLPDDGGEPQMIVEVRDNGLGIPEAQRSRLFERFFRAHEETLAEIEGTGLGLSIVKHVAQNHGGDVRVWSQPGKGSTFTIRLPEASPATAASLGAAQ